MRAFVAAHATDGRMTTQQAADFLGVSRPTVIKLVEQGKIAHCKVGNRRYLALGDVERYRASLGGAVREVFPVEPENVRAAKMRALVRLSEEQGDFDPEPTSMPPSVRR